MIDLLKKTAFIGLGVAALTKDKVEEVAKDFIAKGTLTEKEGERFVAEIVEKSTQAKADLSQMIDEKVEVVLAKADLTKRVEYDELLEQVALLRGEVAALKEQVCSCATKESEE